MDIIAIGDTVVDEFIKLKEASVHCDLNHENCTISMRWGDKIPFEFAVMIPAVGNSANAAVSAARLGLRTAFVANVGNDRYGEEILATLGHEGVDSRYIKVHTGIPTNHHYVLWYEDERTILIRHEEFPYALPADLEEPTWIYLSSLGDHSEAFHDEIVAWLLAHPSVKLAFQPGTFQMKMGKERLADLYARTEVVACNKEEAERILRLGETSIADLLDGMHALGPKIVLITDGPNGAYASNGTERLSVPIFPDPRPALERTGAGDAMASTFVSALALGKTLEEALRWGPINATAVVHDIGAQRGLLTRGALEEALAKAPESYTVTPLS